MKVALVHDWLVNIGGAEEVLLALKRIFPEAPIFTTVFGGRARSLFKKEEVYTSFLNRLPFPKSKKEWLIPLMPFAFERFDLSNFEIVISSSSALAKGVIIKPHQLHLCYCHTPTRFLWMPHIDKRLPKNLLAKILATGLRIWDSFAMARPDIIIANSKNTQANIWKYYRRKSLVVYPPIYIERYKILEKSQIQDYFLTISRLVWQKRVDVIVEAFRENGLPLKIVGEGAMEKKLRKLAKGSPNIQFLGFVDEKTKLKLLSQAKAFIFASEEDFGIAPVEALASGRPVIAYGKGGALEYVIPKKTGLLFREQTKASLNEALKTFQKLDFSSYECRKKAETFSYQAFEAKIKEIVKKAYANKKGETLCKDF